MQAVGVTDKQFVRCETSAAQLSGGVFQQLVDMAFAVAELFCQRIHDLAELRGDFTLFGGQVAVA
ncbi:hypothetical protein D3C85_1878670 [compost metagenome]